MRRRLCSLGLFAALILLCTLALGALLLSPASATPTAPVVIANHTTRQCAEVIQGDDCHWCDLLEGWEVLGPSGGADCPPDYVDLGYQGMSGNCRSYKSRFCCTSPQHHGDCDDLVINEALKQCAFVEEIDGCALPAGWASAADTTPWQGRCPTDWWSGWLPDLACLTAGEVATVTAVAAAATDRPTPAEPGTPAAGDKAPPTATVTPAPSSPGPVAAVAPPARPAESGSKKLTRLALALGSAAALCLLCAVAVLTGKRPRR